jgi:hypothetical protein
MLNWSTFTDWFHAPFREDMSVVDLVLTTGLVIIAAIFWLIVLSHLRKELT